LQIVNCQLNTELRVKIEKNFKLQLNYAFADL